MSAKVSIIVPVYNAEKYLRDCLDSIANQTLSDVQVLMIDDGSKDSSASICKEYADKDPRFEYYHKDNGGTATARNVGLKNAKGEYVGFVDSDDFIESNMYEIMYNRANEEDIDILFATKPGLDDYVDLKTGVYNRDSIIQNIFPNMIPHIISSGTFRTVDWGNWSRIFKRSIISENKIRMYEGSRRCEDFAFCVECTLHANSYMVIDEGELYHYRPNENSKSRSYSKNMWKSIRALMRYMQEMTAHCTEYDFRNAMDYCIFYFASQVVRNEMRNSDHKQIERKISEVLDDELCISAVNAVSSEKMNSEYKSIYSYMKKQDAGGLMSYLKKLQFKKKHIVPITNKVFQNKAVMNLYNKVRGK